MMSQRCKHGVYINKLNCLVCDPTSTNVCKCQNKGTCELCKVYVPICNKINELCAIILSQYLEDDNPNIDDNMKEYIKTLCKKYIDDNTHSKIEDVNLLLR